MRSPGRVILCGFGLILLLASGRGLALGDVVIGEIHYNPAEGPGLEFLELRNTAAEDVAIGGWSFTNGIRFIFPADAAIPAGGLLVVCRDRDRVLEAFTLNHDLVHGNWEGGLDNGGERIVLEDGAGDVVEDLRYDDDAPWDEDADGSGSSLQRHCPIFSGEHPANWRASAPTPLRASGTDVCPPPDLPPPAIAINEIYYHPLNDADAEEEFIELRNNTDAAVNLHGYSFTDGIEFTFEDDAVVEPGGFIVVCRDADRVKAAFEIGNAVGNFVGQLSNDGERITLVDGDGNWIDSVRYGDSGDWPVAPDGLGYSLEKIVPAALGDDPASWAVAQHGELSGWTPLSITGTATSSRLFIYLDEAGEFLIDNVVLEKVDEPGVNLLPNGSFDEGLESWVVRGNHEDTQWEDGGGIDGSGAMRLVSTGRGTGSTNGVSFTFDPDLDRSADYRVTLDFRYILGTQGLTVRLSGSSPNRGIYFRFGSGPALSPGEANTTEADVRPPFVSDIVRSPREPASTDAVWVRARVRADSPIRRVELSYAVDSEAMAGTVALLDDGAHGDGGAGDGVFGAEIPPQGHNSIVLFRVEAEDAAASVTVSPHYLDPTGFHGYYVNDDQQPESKLPVYTLLIDHRSALPPRSLTGQLNCSTYRNASFAHRGDLFYNVGVRRRGQSVCGATKPFMKVRFNRGRDFQGQHKINLQSLWTDKSLVREKFAWDVFHDVGSPYCREDHIRLHVNGRYFGLYADLEHPDSRFLERNRLDGNGNLYKATASREEANGTYEKKTNENGDFTDLREFLQEMHATPRQQLVEFFSQNVDEDRVIDYQLAQILPNNRDYPHKNHYLYHDLERGRWMPITWDMDLTYGKQWSSTFNGVYNDGMDTPGINPWYTTSVDGGLGNHFMDKFFFQAGTWYRRSYLVRLWNALREKHTVEFYDAKIEQFTELLFEEQEEDIAAWGRTAATANDPTAPRDFLPNLERVRGHIRSRLSYLLNYVRARHRDIPGHDRMKITEVYYNPPGPDDEVEFIELWNSSPRDIDVSGWSIEGLGWVFPDGTLVAENEVLVVARDPEAFEVAYGSGIRVLGPYEGRLDNNGEILRLKDAGPEYPATIDFLRYANQRDLSGEQWPALADGLGHSIELTDVHPDRDNDLGRYWRASPEPGGSPGFIEGIASVTEPFRRGDVNADGRVNITDGVQVLFHLFRGFDAPSCLESADTNADGRVNVADAVFLLNALFVQGSPWLPSPSGEECLPSTAGMCETSNCAAEP